MQAHWQALHQDSCSVAIPDGFVETMGPHGEQCVVLEYLIPATHQVFEGYLKCIRLDIWNEQGGVSLAVHFSGPIWDQGLPTPTLWLVFLDADVH